MQIEITEASERDKPVLQSLLQLYLHDLSEFERFDVDEHGRFWYRWLDHYWTEGTRHPFLARVDGQWAGFALVNEDARYSDARYSMAEFFILRKYRRHGVGLRVASDVMRRFPGRWEVRQAVDNTSGTAFWRHVAASLGSFDEPAADRPVQVLEVR